MAKEVRMPKLGLTMTEGTIGEWKKKEGDFVQRGDVLFSVETDKLTNDIEADTEGILLKILVPAGDTVPCKNVVAYIGCAGEQVEGDKRTSEKRSATAAKHTAPNGQLEDSQDLWVPVTPYAKKLAKERGIELDKLDGSGYKGTIVARDVLEYVPKPSIKMTPMARKLAEEFCVDVKENTSGERIRKADILRLLQSEQISGADSSNDSAGDFQDKELEPAVRVSTLRRSIAANMSLSWKTSPCVTYTRQVDTSELQQMRERLRESMEAKKIQLTYNHIIMFVVSRVLMEFPDINASFKDNMLTRHQHVNLGLAVARGDGLLVPNLKHCEGLSLAEIALGTQEMVEAVRSGKVEKQDLSGGTFTITNLGPYGITEFSPIINQPELAILGICEMVDTPVVRNGEIVIRPIMNLCLTADHRVIDGVMAARFLRRIAQILENPYILFI